MFIRLSYDLASLQLTRGDAVLLAQASRTEHPHPTLADHIRFLADVSYRQYLLSAASVFSPDPILVGKRFGDGVAPQADTLGRGGLEEVVVVVMPGSIYFKLARGCQRTILPPPPPRWPS